MTLNAVYFQFWLHSSACLIDGCTSVVWNNLTDALLNSFCVSFKKRWTWNRCIKNLLGCQEGWSSSAVQDCQDSQTCENPYFYFLIHILNLFGAPKGGTSPKCFGPNKVYFVLFPIFTSLRVSFHFLFSFVGLYGLSEVTISSSNNAHFVLRRQTYSWVYLKCWIQFLPSWL